MRREIKQVLLVMVALLGYLNSITAQDSIKPASIYAQSLLFYDFPQSYGIIGGISYPFRRVKNRNDRFKDRFLALDAGFYRYPFNYSGALIMPGYGVRHYRTPSFFYETTVNVGLLRTFYDGRVYAVDADGNVKEKTLFGRYYATTYLSTAFDFKISPRSMFEIKPSAWFQFPFDSFIKPHVSLGAGFKYQIRKK